MLTNEPIPGTRDRFGLELRQREYVTRVLADQARACGYERLQVPLLERASSFTQGVVGRSPWPEWDARSIFPVQVLDYAAGYAVPLGETEALLIPEGTVSVARWLGRYLDSGTGAVLPIKVFYELTCHRNEPVGDLTDSKLREFAQFGMEILGAANPAADTETVTLIHDLLTTLGVPGSAVRIRANDVGIFSHLVAECGIGETETIALKETLDALAECRAGKKPQRRPGLLARAREVLGSCALDTKQREVWEHLLSFEPGQLGRTRELLVGNGYHARLVALTRLRDQLRERGVNLMIDLGVVRSHEYYTGLSFEVDVVTEHAAFVEIAGGGRYDRLVGTFTRCGDHEIVPSMGFAFGVERLTEVLASLGILSGHAERPRTVFRFAAGSAERLLVPAYDDPIVAYLAAWEAARQPREQERVDIYVGDDTSSQAVAAYARQRGIPEVAWC
ncbi:hypothetical protein C3Y87_01715 [Carbonactinospora thermoautotrophica]|uniref:ATP phosphoribosyltransferase regulatory subunit n=1 Tax=Carbonactinospora thermoautotrophica TaxID=1469144 RepID=UPI00226DD5E7|nr:ATP phosphoribosyltransferase regulatory subunit [Carbonactinospora thermoautotrophica]MCX9190149.1 hypothetical protein [Carbonactinospora thermoautotrophica]